MAKKRKTSHTAQPRSLGFRFTKEEEERMRIACRLAQRFMREYGKGRKPYSIDREYYTYKPPLNSEGGQVISPERQTSKPSISDD